MCGVYASEVPVGALAAQTLQNVRQRYEALWIASNQIHELNVAGPRASKNPEVYGLAVKYLRALLG